MKENIKDQFLQFDFGNDLQSQRCYNNKLEATTCAMKEDIIEHTLSKREFEAEKQGIIAKQSSKQHQKVCDASANAVIGT